MSRQSTQKILVTITANQGRLRGCDEDGVRVARWLSDFSLWSCPGATRASVFALFAELRAKLDDDACLVIYLSGHGGWARFDSALAPGLDADLDWPFFVTADQTRSGPFCSLLAVELSVLVHDCLVVTRNVTVIIDACFAPELVRAEHHLKSTGRHRFATPDALLDERAAATLRSKPRSRTLFEEQLLCIDAAGAEQVAYEVEDGHGQPVGAFTMELLPLLAVARRQRCCWDEVVALVDERLRSRWGPVFQRPEACGPAQRRVFELETLELGERVRWLRGPDAQPWIHRGELHGTCVGDSFVIVDGDEIVELEVAETQAHRARLAGPTTSSEDGGLAFPRACADRLEVAIEASDPEAGELDDALAQALRLRPEERGGSAPLRVHARAGSMVISSAERTYMFTSQDRVLRDLDALARARRFELVCARASAPAWLPELGVRLMCRREGRSFELGARGVVGEGDALWLELVNHGHREVPGVHINLVERGVDGCLVVLGADHYPSGVQIRAGTRRTLLWYPDGPHGHRQRWPAAVPRERARVVSWYLLASPVPIDLRSLGRARRDGPTSAWDQAAAAVERPFPARPEPTRTGRATFSPITWACERIQYTLTPWPLASDSLR